jgi:hypothetical protein
MCVDFSAQLPALARKLPPHLIPEPEGHARAQAQPPRHPNTANETPEYQIRRKERHNKRRTANAVLIGLIRRGRQ